MKLFIFIALTISISAHARELRSPKTLYTAMSAAFPSAHETAGGLSMVHVDDLNCAANGMTYECSGISLYGEALHVQDENAMNLHKALVTAGANIDLASIECLRFKCIPTYPGDCRGTRTAYVCTGK